VISSKERGARKRTWREKEEERKNKLTVEGESDSLNLSSELRSVHLSN